MAILSSRSSAVRENIWEFALDNLEPRNVYLNEKSVPVPWTLGDRVRSDIPIGATHPNERSIRTVILSPSEHEQLRSDMATFKSLTSYIGGRFNPSPTYPRMHSIQFDGTGPGSPGLFCGVSGPIEGNSRWTWYKKRLLSDDGWVQIEYEDEALVKQIRRVHG